MRYSVPLEEVRLIRRYKRFLADVERADGEQMTVHCANPGSMMGLAEPGVRAFVSDSGNPKRKLPMSLELVEARGTLVNVNTGRVNAVAREALEAGAIAELAPLSEVRPEPRLASGSRLDFVAESANGPVYIEVKSVTLVRERGLAEFPDAKTTRGARHLEELIALKAEKARAAMLFLVQRGDGVQFAPARDIDPAYAEALARASHAGVDILCYSCLIGLEGIEIDTALPIRL